MREIDLSKLHNNVVDKLVISGTYLIPKEYYQDTDIISLSNIEVEGEIKRETSDMYYIELSASGDMTLQDSISLEEEKYPFSFKIDRDLEEFTTNLENSLDILQLLWENIVLEIPLKFTKVEDLSKFHGDGWRLISEEEVSTTNNPFKQLLQNQEEE